MHLRTFVSALFAVAFLFSWTGWSNEAPAAPPVQWSQIKGWKNLGHRFVGALDEKGNVLAIYDLSYPDLMSRLPFTLIGGRKVSKSEIIKVIWSAKFNPELDPKLAEDAIDELEKAQPGPIDNGSLPQEWWKQLPWKNPRMLGNQEPEVFRLSDLNLRYGMKSKDQSAFDQAVKDLETAFAESEGTQAAQGLMDRFEFRRLEAGSYEVSYLSHETQRGVSKPRKIADLVSTKHEFLVAFKLEVAKQSFGKAVSFIPGNILAALVGTAVERFFHFHELVLRSHQNMLVEALQTIQEGKSNALQPGEMNRAIEAISFAQSSVLSGWKWLWKKPTEEWAKEASKQLEFSDKNQIWLNKNQWKQSSLNPRFSFGLDSSGQLHRLFVLSSGKPNSKSGPATAIDFNNINQIKNRRLGLEVMSTAVEFGHRFIPIAGGLIKRAYEQFVEDPANRARIWEARLTWNLEERTQEDHATNLGVLDQQRVNPLFQNRAQMEALIQARRKLL